MRLDEDRNAFKAIIQNAAFDLDILDDFIEKDYWIFLLLKTIFKNKEREYVFKGGTSLSKCYGLINRFSEDIDISYSSSFESNNSGEIKRKFRGITRSVKELGLEINNTEKLRWNRYFNQFIVPYESFVDDRSIEKNVIIELAAQTPSFPSEEKEIDSFIGQYFKKMGREDLISLYELEPFMIRVQSLSRTLIDKTFAICDYYLTHRCSRHSRHLYDMNKILAVVELNERLSNLFLEVKEYRKRIKVCVSARGDHKIHNILSEIIEEESFKNDFENITSKLLYEKCSYASCESSLKQLKNFLEEHDI